MNSRTDLFYTDSGLVIDRALFENSENLFVGNGNYGSVYRYEDDKVVKFVESKGTCEQYETVSFIKNLSLPNFYKIYDVLSCSIGDVKTFGGTISQYYPEEDIDIFLQPSDYLLDSFNALHSAMVKLGSNFISVFDMNNRNTIVNGDGIFVIDADLYQRMSTTLSGRLEKKNVFKLKSSIFYELLQSNFFRHHFDEASKMQGNELSKMIYDLLNLDSYEDASVFNKTLSKYKYPIEYVKSKI